MQNHPLDMLLYHVFPMGNLKLVSNGTSVLPPQQRILCFVHCSRYAVWNNSPTRNNQLYTKRHWKDFAHMKTGQHRAEGAIWWVEKKGRRIPTAMRRFCLEMVKRSNCWHSWHTISTGGCTRKQTLINLENNWPIVSSGCQLMMKYYNHLSESTLPAARRKCKAESGNVLDVLKVHDDHILRIHETNINVSLVIYCIT